MLPGQLFVGDVTQLLNEIDPGDPEASEQLLPLVYTELRSLARRKMSQEQPGATLQATALVHEAYVRLVQSNNGQGWSHRGHFFCAAAEAMRRILVEAARSKSRLKRGGDRAREEFDEDAIASPNSSEQVLSVHESLDVLEASHPEAAKLVKLRYFVGFTINESAEAMGISPRKANQLWAYARVWLMAEMGE